MSPSFALLAGELRPDARVAVVRDGDDTVGFWPVTVDRFGAAGPLFPGWTDVQGMVAAPGWECDWVSVLAAGGLSGWRFDHLMAHQSDARRAPVRVETSPAMDLGAGWEAYDAWLTTHHKRFIQRKRSTFRKAAREHHVEFTERDDRADSLPALIRMKSSQCRQRGWVDLFASSSAVDMVERAARVRSDDMCGFISTLRFDGEIAAATLFLDSTSSRALWMTAFDERWRAYAPGLMLTLKAGETAADRGLRCLSFGKGAEEYKLRFGSTAETLVSGVVIGRGVGAKLFSARTAPYRAAQALWRQSPVAEVTIQRAVRTIRGLAYQRSPAAF